VGPVEAAALSGTGASAIGVLRDAVGLRPGERVLARGANGGVGTAAVQVARALGGRVTALAGAPHLDRVRDLGAEQAFDYHTASPRDLGRFDVIVDPVGRNMRPYRRLLAPGGRMAAMAIGSPGDTPTCWPLASTAAVPRRSARPLPLSGVPRA
jgi:NADPH:quinone reductase-like Zn-dependent oxidoreductase